MSSIIITRIILAAFLSISITACSKDSKGSASVRNKGGQPTAQKSREQLEAEAKQKAAAEKSPETPADKGSTPEGQDSAAQTDGDDKDSSADDSAETASTTTSTIKVTPIAPTIKAPTAQTSQATPAPVKAPTPAAKPAPVPAPVKAAAPVVQPVPAAAPAPVKATTSQAPAKPAVESVKTPAPAKEITPAVKPAPAKASTEVAKPAASTAKKTVNPKTITAKPATTKSTAKPVASKAADKSVDSAEAKRLAEEKAKADAAIQAARREIVIKSEADLDKDDSSKENLGASAYKAIVDKLLAGIDMNSAVIAGRVADSNYFSFDRDLKQTNDLLPLSLAQNLVDAKICDIEATKGCLMIEVTKDNKVVASNIGTQTKFDEKMKLVTGVIYRKDILNPSADLQADIEKLSRISGGKTVVFTQAK
jgi:hypothetical protein